jgi:PKD repeat protein
MRYAALPLLALLALPAPLLAGPDGLDLRSSQNVRMEMVFACGGDDAMCLKARDTATGNPDYDVRNITTSNVVIYNDGFRATKIGTETDAEFFEDILYENIHVVKAGIANTLYLTDTATVRNVVYKNFYVESGGGDFGVGSQGFAGRTPTGHAEHITFSNLVTNGGLSFYGYSPSTATTDSGAINYRDRSSGTLYTNPALITGTNATNITLKTNPVIAQEMEFPIEGSRHLLPGTVKVRARVFHETGQPMTVEFFNHGNSIGSDSTAPYEIDWAAPEGEHSLTFSVTDGANTDELLAPRRFEVRSEPAFTSVQVLPGSLDIGTGLSRQFQARALDQYGDILDTQPASWSWSVSGGGTVDSNGSVTAGETESGPHTVSAEGTLGATTLSGNASFTVTNSLTISNMIVSTGKEYVWDTLANGKLIYMDRTSTFSSVPAQYLGKYYLRNSNSDKNVSGTVVSFEVSLPVIVYVAVTGDFDTNQSWFDGYTDTGTFLMSKRVYAKSFEPGIIALGRNGTSNMYHVMLNYPLGANADPVAGFSATPTSGQAPLTVDFDASSSYDSDGSVVRYDWDFGDGTTLPDGGPVPQHTYTAEGVYTASLTVTDNLDATGILVLDDYIFVGNEQPVASFAFNPTQPGAGETITFDATGSTDPDGSIVLYDWDFGDGTVLLDAGPTPTHSYSTEDVFTVLLTVTDNDGATDQSSAVVSTIPPGEIALIYHYTFDANGGTGTTVNDVSGFGIPANATTYVNTTPTQLFTNATPSPDGSFYGNFETDRSSLQFDISKWNDDTNGVAGGSNAFTVILLVRDFDGASVDADGTNFFATIDNDLQFGFTGGTGPRPLHFRANDGARITTSATADLSNASTGDSNGWILLAMTYSSETDTANFYLGREFDAATGWTLSLVESLAYSTSSLIDEGNPLAFGDNSARDPDAKFDDLRVYNGVLSPEEIAAIGAPPPPPAPPIPVVTLSHDATDWILSVASEPGFSYEVRTATDLSAEPALWPSTGAAQSGSGSTLQFTLPQSSFPANPVRFFVIEGSAE